MTSKARGTRTEPPDATALALAADEGSAFGPAFFLTQLARFVRARCPDPDEHLPIVELALHDGSQLDLCHVIGLAPRWAALAAYEPSMSSRGQAMRTELVPYASIVRVTIRTTSASETRLGFSQPSPPAIVHTATSITPEAMLRVAATASDASRPAASSGKRPSADGPRGSAAKAGSRRPPAKTRKSGT